MPTFLHICIYNHWKANDNGLDQHSHLHILESASVVSCLLHRKFSGFSFICFLGLGAFAVVLYDS